MKIHDVATEINGVLGDVLREFVLNKERLAVSSQPTTNSITVKIKSDPADCGRIIGGKGLHFKSLAAFVTCIGLKHEMAIDLAPMPEPSGRALRYESFRGRNDWRRAEISGLMRRVVQATVQFPQAVIIQTEDEPGFVTRMTVHIAKLEQHVILESMVLNPDGSQTGWLRVLFNAVGKANGRNIFVEVVPTVECDPQQPKEASGRFAGEMQR